MKNIKMKISVITAAFKSKDTVRDAISSVGSQTYQNIEHIVIEGNSCDGTLKVIEDAWHDRMTLISEPDNGIYDALNKGILNSSGDIIGFMHSDDFFAHDRVLEQIASEFNDPSVEAVFGDLVYISKTDQPRIIRNWSTGNFRRWRLRFGWMPAHPTLYVRRSVYETYGLYDEKLAISADYDFILRYFSKAMGKSVYIPQVLYHMRVGGASNRNLVANILKMKEDILAIRRNRVGGIYTLFFKKISKLYQFSWLNYFRKITKKYTQ